MRLQLLTFLVCSIIYLDLNAQSVAVFKNENPQWRNIPVFPDEFQLDKTYVKVDTMVQSWQRVVYDEQSLRRLNHTHLKRRSEKKHIDAIVITFENYDPEKKWMLIHADLYRKFNEDFWLKNLRIWLMF